MVNFALDLIFIPKISTLKMERDITLYQDNAITKASYDMSALEKDILLVLISQINRNDKAAISYFIEAREIMERKGERIAFEDFRKAGFALLTRGFETWLDDERMLQGTFISSAIYHKGKGIIEVKVDPNVLVLYQDLKKNFTTMQLNMALSLNSKYAKRLYEQASMLKNFPKPSTIIDLYELKKRLGVAVFQGDKLVKDVYPNFADFDKRVLKKAQKEIEATDVNFTYELLYDKNCVRGRRKVTAIKFNVVKVAKEEPAERDPQYHTIFTRLTNEFRLRTDQAESVLQNMDRKQLLRLMYDITLERPKIKNIGAYTAKILGI